MPEQGKLMVVRHEAHTGLSATYAAAINAGAPVKVTAAKTISVAAVGDTIVGVAHHTITAQNITDGLNRGTFRLKGDVIPMQSAAAIAAGALVVVGTTGRVVTRAAEPAEDIVGVAWTAATAADQEIQIIVL